MSVPGGWESGAPSSVCERERARAREREREREKVCVWRGQGEEDGPIGVL